MGIFDKFSMPNPLKKPITKQIEQPKYSPIMGQASTFKTVALFDLEVGTPRFNGDIPNAVIKSYEDLR